ncbi:hypothetical protein JYU34_020328 [Plutella xylostella]|uniref:Reverse transcriptase domain-containing protein n=1 Tax=Plutella xylostella TaxID=51655 RepID=A0ABQ7PVP2_PLUXY|nr:hypothetical protein JYU34_020328 [Plutella xylostella]
MIMTQDKYLKLSLFNAGSLSTSHDDFIAAMLSITPDIIAINETWIRKDEKEKAPSVPGYRLRYTPRPESVRNGRGGGVGFYIKRGLHVRYLQGPSCTTVDQMWLRSSVNGKVFLIGTAYRPHWVHVDTFFDALTESILFFSDYEHLILMGDFNINFLDHNESKTKQLHDFLTSTNLIQYVNEPTHFTQSSETLIDLFCTNTAVREVKVTHIPDLNRHAIVTVTINVKKTKFIPRTISLRPIKDIDLSKFNKDLDTIRWDLVISVSCVNDMVNLFHELLTQLFDFHAPIKSLTIRDKPMPWLTSNIRKMMECRNAALARYRKNKSETNKIEYKQLKLLVARSLLTEKRAYFNDYINKNIKNSKLLWSNLKKTVFENQNTKEELPNHMNKPNEINKQFINVPGPKFADSALITYYKSNKFHDNRFKLSEVSEDVVAKAILGMKSNAKGMDEISLDMIMLTLPQTLTVITKIINKSIQTKVFPEDWKTAKVKPIPKNSNPQSFKELRPISLLPILSKLLEKVVYDQLMKFLEDNDVLPSLQSGFRKNRGTSTALIDVVDNILAAQEEGKATALVLLDFSRAFDAINLPLLLSKLEYYGIDTESINWFSSYLENRAQHVVIDNTDGSFTMSEREALNRGVPQGSILGPLLFIIYSADLTHTIADCKYHIYADDTQVYISFDPKDTNSAIQKLNKDLDNINVWANKNTLVLNPAKSKFLILGSRKQISAVESYDFIVEIQQQPLERVWEARNLGVIMDAGLKFEHHVSELAKVSLYKLKLLYRIRDCLSKELRVKLCVSGLIEIKLL